MPDTCDLWMTESEDLARNLLNTDHTDYKVIGEALLEALHKDQHELFHDGEFVRGCSICDEERKLG